MDSLNHFINQIILFIMKIFTVLFCSLSIQACTQSKNTKGMNQSNSIEYNQTLPTNIKEENTTENIHQKKNSVPSVKKDTILNNIQNKIIIASYDGFAKKNTEKLDDVEKELNNSNVSNINLKNYWVAYINYYKTIIEMQMGKKKLMKSSNMKGINVLDKNIHKNSDDYALLSLLKGLSFSYSPGIEAMSITKDINELLEKGTEANDKNFRVYYAKASIDFYTPKEYGGGTKTEEALLKAITLPEINHDSSLPTWGKEETYDLIIRFYLREKQKDKAKTYFEKAKQIFPKSYIIQVHQSNFNSE
ncbi:hypothetical protein CMU59_14225 [Elizabethkingia anophelis]|nr:hypothetical protein BBD30_15665 [Elizabethkingia anophelis]MDV3566843.1 hypothetical protein [Elizabethkingia anophelis]MDV3575424.1 hypothetical protein [Elizabethkingia anophelis]MDV3599625.1 hypothetical protein [Elizabethkingia anophelis]MDV3639805.1 hypothetical protein [Elizabethkingia anophelis]